MNLGEASTHLTLVTVVTFHHTDARCVVWVALIDCLVLPLRLQDLRENILRVLQEQVDSVFKPSYLLPKAPQRNPA